MKLIRNLLIGLYTNMFLVILLFILMFKSSENPRIDGWVLFAVLCTAMASSVLCIVFGITNIMNVFQLWRKNEYNSLRKYMKIIKFGAVPYFIVNFIVYAFMFFIFFVASRGFIIFSPIPLIYTAIIIFTYLAVIITSSYGIGFLAIIKKKKRIKGSSFVIHILLQLCFVLDVIDTIILVFKYKNELSEQQDIMLQ